MFLNSYSPDIISINETKCDNLIASKHLNFQSYNLVHRERKNGLNGAGGVGLFIKKNIKYTRIFDFDHLNIELISVKIQIDQREVIIVSYYNPPDQMLSLELFKLLNKCSFILCGDLNAKSFAYGCQSYNQNGKILDQILNFKNIVRLSNCSMTYKSFSNKKEEILDYIFSDVSIIKDIDNFEVLNCLMGSNHYPMLIRLNNSVERNDFIQNDQKKFEYNKANWDLFKSLLPSCIPDDINNDLNELNEFITKSLLNCAEKAIPSKQVKLKNELPKYIIDLIFFKNTLKKSKCDKAKYNKIKKIIKDEIIAFKNSKWQKFLNSLGSKATSSRPFWQRIKTANNRKPKNKSIPNLFYNQKSYVNEEEKVNLFGSILEEVFKNGDEPNFDNEFKQKIEKKVDNRKFNFKLDKPLTIKELDVELKNLNKNASAGHDKIHNLMLLNSSSDFKQILLKLFNTSLSKSTLPKSWKIASTTGQFCVTSCLGKLCEKLVYKRLNDFIQENNLVLDEQSGFRRKRQTKDNLVHLIQKIIESFNRKKKVCTILFDIASAFDKVWHKGLIYKMIDKNIPEYLIAWCQNFLEFRKFFVRINNTCSILLRSNDANEGVSINSLHKGHDHVEEAEITMLIARNSTKENIRVNKGTVKNVFEKSVNKAFAHSELSLKDAAKFAPKYKNEAKTLYKIKNKDQVSKDKLPNQIEDINFDGEYNEYTLTNCKKRFLLFDDKKEDRILCFSSNIQLEILAKCTRWHVDGTFKACPSLFYQVYLIITLSLKHVHFTPIVPICNYYFIDSPNANHLNFINYSFGNLKLY
ncbi:unnamed protein product [Brachionus calyciflorus]|uniref:Uncharacterized protein n=1 Tax=Brachionus calyciflorus TaxID=104777 RepID=A0A814G328_9BILA|nr:unnamed protein product [Brachionus calyciflorus]